MAAIKSIKDSWCPSEPTAWALCRTHEADREESGGAGPSGRSLVLLAKPGRYLSPLRGYLNLVGVWALPFVRPAPAIFVGCGAAAEPLHIRPKPPIQTRLRQCEFGQGGEVWEELAA